MFVAAMSYQSPTSCSLPTCDVSFQVLNMLLSVHALAHFINYSSSMPFCFQICGSIGHNKGKGEKKAKHKINGFDG